MVARLPADLDRLDRPRVVLAGRQPLKKAGDCLVYTRAGIVVE